jgi:hypothetical protein
LVWSESIDVDQSVGNNYTGNADPLFDMIDRHTVQIELPTTTTITGQCKAAASSDEPSKRPFVHPDPLWQLRAQMQSLYAPGGSAISGHCIITPDMADLLGSPACPLLAS